MRVEDEEVADIVTKFSPWKRLFTLNLVADDADVSTAPDVGVSVENKIACEWTFPLADDVALSAHFIFSALTECKGRQ